MRDLLHYTVGLHPAAEVKHDFRHSHVYSTKFTRAFHGGLTHCVGGSGKKSTRAVIASASRHRCMLAVSSHVVPDSLVIESGSMKHLTLLYRAASLSE